MIDQQLRDLARAVAAQLDGFQVQTDNEIGHAVWLGHPDGRRLFVRRPWNHHDRVEISGHYPHSDYYFGPGEHIKITVAIAREPAAIAKEITRRLLPAYVQVLAKVQAHLARQAADDTRRAQLAARLARLIPGASVHDDGHHSTTIRWYTSDQEPIGYGRIELRHDATSATFKADSLPPATLERLAAALASLAPTSTKPSSSSARHRRNR